MQSKRVNSAYFLVRNVIATCIQAVSHYLFCPVSKVRDLLAGTFNQLVKAVALAAVDGDADEVPTGGDNTRTDAGDNEISEGFLAGEKTSGRATPAEGEAAGSTVEQDGEVRLGRFLAPSGTYCLRFFSWAAAGSVL